ncbi:Bifunctional lysine-specific demethylase and histidyl-hydroxylase [Nymphaea thermarum]|nr:Bifunctional lysine-specific demethylase and histidyl-hydroxylase [Nymphaea thermarum]
MFKLATETQAPPALAKSCPPPCLLCFPSFSTRGIGGFIGRLLFLLFLFSSLNVTVIMNFRYTRVASLSCEMVGAISLCSYEANVKLASDIQLLNGLSFMFSRKHYAVVAACNAIMDLATTSVGLAKLEESCALEKLLSVLCDNGTPLGKSYPSSNRSMTYSSSTEGKCLGDGILVLLDVLAILVNTSSIERLMRIPTYLFTSSLCTLKELWCTLVSRVVSEKGKISNEEGCACDQGAKLAEVIFRLSMIQNQHITYGTHVLEKSLFGNDDSHFEFFMLNNWENSAALVKKSSKAYMDSDDVFCSLADSLKSRNIDDLLNFILNGLVSCPPVMSDELNILQFLEDVKGELGHPIRYSQDIRLVRTVEELSRVSQDHLQKEIHFFRNCTSAGNEGGPDCFNAVTIEDCKNAYSKGYTISLRGMEFRWKRIAAITHTLAMIFGQPSSGANLYLTPPQAQGLARHCDDHCVFVCQLVGQKKWTVFPRQAAALPRLYEQSSCLHHLDCESGACEGAEFLLSEGDILYVPRGCAHEAHTVIKDNVAGADKVNEFSLHLTLSIEVEPPFEWEGFAHVALYSWSRARTWAASDQFRCNKGKVHLMVLNFLHVSIRLIAHSNHSFRKACLVGAFSKPLELKYGDVAGNESLPMVLDQKAFFLQLIDTINDMCNFYDAFATVESAVKENDSQSLEWMMWLKNLQEAVDDIKGEKDWSNPLDIFKELVEVDKTPFAEIEWEFLKVKSAFCKEVVFEDVTEKYKLLLGRYMTVRNYYTNGMLSLHHTAYK